MLLVGLYKRGNPFIFRITLNSYSREFMLLQVDSSLSDTELELAVSTATGKSSTINKSNLLIHAITNSSFDIRALYGDMDIATAFLKDLYNIKFFTKYNEDDIKYNTSLHDIYELSNSSYISVLYAIPETSRVSKLRGLSYAEYSEKVLRKSDISLYAKSNRVRTLDDLINKLGYDLSWILNKDGTYCRDYRTVTTPEQLEEVLDGVKTHDIISLDYETNDLDFYHYKKSWQGDKKPKIVGIGISWQEGTARYIPLVSEKFECLPYAETIEVVLSALSKKKLIGANLLFDFRVSYFFGYTMNCAWDVMYAEFVIDPTGSRGHKKLKEITRYYCGWETLELDDVLGGVVDGRLIPELDKDVITIYGGADVDTVWSVMRHQKEYLDKYLNPVLWKMDMSMITLISIEDYYGCKIDEDTWNVLNTINDMDIEKLTLTIWEYLLDKVSHKLVKDMFKTKYNKDLSDSEISEVLANNPQLKNLSKDMLHRNNKAKTQLQLSSSNDLLFIFSEILEYPIYRDFLGKVSFDDNYLAKLINETTDYPELFLKEDILSYATEIHSDLSESLSSKDTVLISKKEFEHCKYPFALLLREWRKLDKRKNSFLEPVKENSVDGWYCNLTSMTAADTARFINPTQVMQGYMKRLIVPYSNDRYFVQFDLAQIEFRVMIGDACITWNRYLESFKDDEDFKVLKNKDISYLIDKLNVWWTDFHREGGSVLVGTSPAKMTKAERSRVKPIHFAVPYGGNEYTIAADKLLVAHSEEEKNEILEDTREILAAWRSDMLPLYSYLEGKRDNALVQVPDSELPPRLKGGKWGKVTNSLGRWRWYSLDYEKIAEMRLLEDGRIDVISDKESSTYKSYVEKATRSLQATIRKSAGNYPVQSNAREFFALIMVRLFTYCRQHGLSGTGSYDTDKIIQSLMIHDENHLEVSKDIHPFKIYQILYENCVLHLNGYPTFYMGISICDSWYESKDDKYEAPVKFVQDIIKSYKENPEKYESEQWQDSPKEYVLKYLVKWIAKECDEFIQSWTKDNVFSLVEFRNNNENYFFLIKPSLYTKKFLNEEQDITKEELVLLFHNTNPNLIVDTGKRKISMKDYVWTFEQQQQEDLKTSEFNTEISEDDIDDLFDIEDFEEDFDYDDNAYKDDLTRKCYWLYSEAERRLDPDYELASLRKEYAVTRSIAGNTYKESEEKKSILYAIGGQWFLDARQLTQNQFTVICKYLKAFKDERGIPITVLFLNGARTYKTLYSKNIDIRGLNALIE